MSASGHELIVYDYRTMPMSERMATRAHWQSAFQIVLLTCICAGCGSSDRAHVTGRVLKQDGSPLASAKLIATSAETGQSATASTDTEGRFVFGTSEPGDGIPFGNYNVVVVEDLGDMDNRRAPTIAARYRDSSKSGISFSVSAGEAKELDLKLDPP
jgi:hypothetical protein